MLVYIAHFDIKLLKRIDSPVWQGEKYPISKYKVKIQKKISLITLNKKTDQLMNYLEYKN